MLIYKGNTLPCEGEWRKLLPGERPGIAGPEAARSGPRRTATCTRACTSVALAALLAACGGGGTGEPAPACQDSVTVQLYGDSTQRAAFDWGYLQQELDARFGAGRVRLVDQAVSGTDSAQLVAGTDGTNPPWPGNLAADIAVVNFGINDVRLGVSLDVYAQNMAAFAGATQARMIVETPNPVVVADDAPYAQAGRAAAAEAGVPVADVQAFVLGLRGWQSMLSDGIHPTHELQAAIAHAVTAPAIAAVAAPLLCR